MKTRPDVPKGLVYNPYDKAINSKPHPVWKRMRDEAPLYYNEEYDFYALSRYKDVLEGLKNWQRYSSARGTVLELMQVGDNTSSFSSEIMNLGLMIFSDPPEHDIARRMVAEYFTPTAVVQYEQRARKLCQTFFDKFEGQSEFDLADDLVRAIPPMMIGEILGVPEEDQAYLGRLVDASLTYDPDKGPDTLVEGVRAGNDSHKTIAEYIGQMVQSRMGSPRQDMLSELLVKDVTEVDGSVRKLNIQELISFFMLLQSAGSETTARALCWAGVLLSRHPGERKKLVDDPSKIPAAVEEILRYEPPSPIQVRYVMEDVEWHGVRVPQGSKLAMLNGSAGRDERMYEDPDVFNVDRKVIQHLTFGFSKHVCLGASLARLEMKVVLEELLKRYPEWYVDEERVEMISTTTVRGPKHVPCQV